MQILTLILTSLFLLTGLLGLFKPQKLIQFVNVSWESDWGFWFAVCYRLVLGILLFLISDSTRYPIVIYYLGILFIFSGVTGFLIGKKHLTKLIDWWLSKPENLCRGWSVIAVAFGLFLIYAIY